MKFRSASVVLDDRRAVALPHYTAPLVVGAAAAFGLLLAMEPVSKVPDVLVEIGAGGPGSST